MHSNFSKIQLYFKLFLIILFCSCGEASIRKEPFTVTLARYENRSTNHVFLAHAGDSCSLLFHKRIHNALFLWPINGYSKEEITDIANQKMIRYKNVLRTGDLFWNLLFFTTLLTYSVEVESCDTGMVAIPRHEMEFLKESAREKDKAERYKKELDLAKENMDKMSDRLIALQKEKADLEKNGVSREVIAPTPEEKAEVVSKNPVYVMVQDPKEKDNSDRPILKNYKKLILKSFLDEEQPFSVLFSSGKSELTKQEKKKLDSYVKSFLEKYPTERILLIGHTDWEGKKKQNFDLSAERAEAVSKYLLKLGVPENKLFVTFSGGLWPDNSEDKLVKHWNRRVDLLILE